MSRITSVNDIKRLGTIMSIWAHPDDESFTAAGIMATAIQNGQEVICVTATRGEAGVQDEVRWPATQLGDIRERELHAALKHLGIRNHYWLDYRDGYCHEVDRNQAVAELKQLIDHHRPDTILTFGPDGMTGHTDHQAVSDWVDEATKDTDIAVYHIVEEERRYLSHMIDLDKKFNIYFNIDKPPVLQASQCNIAFHLPQAIIDKKCAALRAMPSQTEVIFKNVSAEVINAMLGDEYYILARKQSS